MAIDLCRRRNVEKMFYSTPLSGTLCKMCGARNGSMRRSAVFLFVFLALTSLTLALIPQGSSQPENIKVLSYSWYIDSIGFFVVVGEVQNVGPNTIASVGLSGTVYTTDGTPQVNSGAYAYVLYLRPQQKAPFYMDFDPQSSLTGDLSWLSLGIDHVDFTINLAEATGNYSYPNVTVKTSSGATGSEGVYWVTGTVQNTGTQTAKNIRVVATYYNATGTVVAMGYTDPLTPTSLTPSSIASFKVGAFDLNQTLVPSNEKIESYNLLVQVEEPIITGTLPSVSPFPTPSGTSPSVNPTPTQTPSNSASSPLTPEAVRGIIVVIAVVAVAGTLLFLRRRKSQTKSKAVTKRKSQMNRRKRRSRAS
jgi:hypothetical protein